MREEDTEEVKNEIEEEWRLVERGRLSMRDGRRLRDGWERGRKRGRVGGRTGKEERALGSGAEGSRSSIKGRRHDVEV